MKKKEKNENDLYMKPINSVLTTHNYDEYKIKTYDGKTEYNRNGPIINNFVKKYKDEKEENNEDYNDNKENEVINVPVSQFKKEESISNIKSILKKPSIDLDSNMSIYNNNNSSRFGLEKILITKQKQDDINNDIYIEIGNNLNNERKERAHSIRKYVKYEKMTMIHEKDETIETFDNDTINNENNNTYNNENNVYNDIYSNENNTITNIENNNIINEDKNYSNYSNKDELFNNENNKNLSIEESKKEYNREDLLSFLKINKTTIKENELSNEKFKIIHEREKHDPVLLEKIEKYQNILDIASISAIDIVDLIEHNINIRPIIKNIIYNIQQNITLFSQEDIKNLEDMFVAIKSFKSEPNVTIKNNFDIIAEKVIEVPYPK
eukprot:jgi/Orpsp1_1/1192777/evm.model.d7180000095824.1